MRASSDDPQYRVRSTNSGKVAVHKPDALQKRSEVARRGTAIAKGKAVTWKEFHEVVNMTAGELESWLGTEESRQVGDKDSDTESTGHRSGRRVVSLLRSKKADLTGDDYAHMRKVVGYVRRHLAHLPSGNISDSAWRYSVMNWGHDPCKN